MDLLFNSEYQETKPTGGFRVSDRTPLFHPGSWREKRNYFKWIQGLNFFLWQCFCSFVSAWLFPQQKKRVWSTSCSAQIEKVLWGKRNDLTCPSRSAHIAHKYTKTSWKTLINWLIHSSWELQVALIHLLNTHLTSICPGVRAACLHTAESAGETPPRSWHTGPFLSGLGRPFLRVAACTDVQSTAATSGRSPCSTR